MRHRVHWKRDLNVGKGRITATLEDDPVKHGRRRVLGIDLDPDGHIPGETGGLHADEFAGGRTGG